MILEYILILLALIFIRNTETNYADCYDFTFKAHEQDVRVPTIDHTDQLRCEKFRIRVIKCNGRHISQFEYIQMLWPDAEECRDLAVLRHQDEVVFWYRDTDGMCQLGEQRMWKLEMSAPDTWISHVNEPYSCISCVGCFKENLFFYFTVRPTANTLPRELQLFRNKYPPNVIPPVELTCTCPKLVEQHIESESKEESAEDANNELWNFVEH